MYTKSDFLEKHRDRTACEISLSIRVDGDTDWPLYFDANEEPKDGEKLNLENQNNENIIKIQELEKPQQTSQKITEEKPQQKQTTQQKLKQQTQKEKPKQNLQSQLQNKDKQNKQLEKD